MIASFAKECSDVSKLIKSFRIFFLYSIFHHDDNKCINHIFTFVFFFFSKGRSVKMETSQLVIRWLELELALSQRLDHLPTYGMKVILHVNPSF